MVLLLAEAMLLSVAEGMLLSVAEGILLSVAEAVGRTFEATMGVPHYLTSTTQQINLLLFRESIAIERMVFIHNSDVPRFYLLSSAAKGMKTVLGKPEIPINKFEYKYIA